MDSLLGGSFASRITSNIREQKGYTYSPFSQIGTRRHLAYWVQSADVTTAVTGPSLNEIFYEIDRIRKEPPSARGVEGHSELSGGPVRLAEHHQPGRHHRGSCILWIRKGWTARFFPPTCRR